MKTRGLEELIMTNQSKNTITNTLNKLKAPISPKIIQDKKLGDSPLNSSSRENNVFPVLDPLSTLSCQRSASQSMIPKENKIKAL